MELRRWSRDHMGKNILGKPKGKCRVSGVYKASETFITFANESDFEITGIVFRLSYEGFTLYQLTKMKNVNSL